MSLLIKDIMYLIQYMEYIYLCQYTVCVKAIITVKVCHLILDIMGEHLITLDALPNYTSKSRFRNVHTQHIEFKIFYFCS